MYVTRIFFDIMLDVRRVSLKNVIFCEQYVD